MSSTALTEPAVPRPTDTRGGRPSERPWVGAAAPVARLTAIELRKAVDTRSGRALVLLVLGLGLAGLGWELNEAGGAPISFESWMNTSVISVLLILPVVGVLAMTAEWTQRTALSTFALVPRRGRVLAAKVGSAVVLGTAVVGAVLAATAVAVVIGCALTGAPAHWGAAGVLVAGALLVCALQVLMGVAFGSLIPQSAAAITAFFVLPKVWSELGSAWLGDGSAWADVYGATGRLATFEGHLLPQTLTSLAIWIVLPLAVGIVVNLRRDVA